MRINNSEGKVNWTQRNNEYIWRYPKSGTPMVRSATMCNVTSLCMQYSYDTGADFPSGRFKQPEDNFAEFIMVNPDVMRFYKNTHPDLYEDFISESPVAYTPNEVHAVLEYAFNLWMGKEAIKFSTNMKIKDIVNTLKNGKCVTSSGSFPYYSSTLQKNSILHHINVIVGLEAEGKKVKKFIIDDPYGDIRQDYKPGYSGNNIEITTAEFLEWYKPARDTRVKFGYVTVG